MPAEAEFARVGGETEPCQAPANPLQEFLEAHTDYPTLQAFWDAVQHGIRERLGLDRFSIWFRQTELMGGDEARLVVGVPNVIIQQFLTAQYTEAVSATVRELVGRPMAVSFDVAPRLFRQMRARQREQSEAGDAESRLPAALGPPVDVRPSPPRVSFDDLIPCRASRLPFAAARELAGQQNPRLRFLYICGHYGAGKSALLQAVRTLAAAPERGLNVVLMTAEDWCNEYYHAIQRRSTHLFRSRYRSCDMLLLDDVQFIEGNKAAGQRELLHTIKHILDAGGRVALGGAPHPEELEEVDPALKALLRSAFPAVMAAPERDETPAIVRQLAARKGLDAVEEVHELIARHYGESFRSMEAAVCRLALYAGVSGCGKLELRAARDAFAAMRPAAAEPVGLDGIRDAVVAAFPVTAEQLLGRSRSRTIVRARHVAIYLAGRLTDASLAEIGHAFGGLTHSSVKHAADKIARQCEDDEQLAAAIQKLLQKLGSP